jgi:GYF domain 2
MDEKISQWYYVYNGQQQGPVDEGTMQQLMQNRIINANTLTWQVGMPSWLPLQSTSLQALVPVTNMPPTPPVAPLSAAPYYGTQVMPQAVVNAESLKQLFMVFWILLAVSIPLAFIVIGFFTAAAAGVIAYILLYRYWQVIQDGNVRTTPGKAVGYSFIPFFNFYWIFQAFHGLTQDMNRYVRERNIQAPAVSEGLGLTFCILILCSVIPYVDIVTSIAALVILIILFNQLTKTSEAIINSRTNH